MNKISAIKFFVITILGLSYLLNNAPVYGQKAPKRNGKKMPEATLAETKVVAKLMTNAYEIQPLKVRMNYINPIGKRSTIGIRNRQNDLVYYESFFGKEYLRDFDFTTMASGEYSFNINSRKDYMNRPFAIQSIKSRKIAFSETGRVPSNYLASIYQPEDIKVNLHLNNTNGKEVEVLIRNEKGATVYQGYEKGKQIAKALELSTLDDGKYTLQVKNRFNDNSENLVRNFEITTSWEKEFAWINKKGNTIKQDKATAFIK